jgi:hypothetical protein
MCNEICQWHKRDPRRHCRVLVRQHEQIHPNPDSDPDYDSGTQRSQR